MGIFSKLSADNLEQAGDRIGGFAAQPSDAYDGIIKVAYLGKSTSSKSQSVTVVADCGGKEIRETIWITNKDDENFYFDKQDKTKKHPLPGFTTINDMCLLVTGEPLDAQEAEEKIVKVYNPTEKKEVPTAVQTIAGLTGKPIKLGVLRVVKNKQKKNDAGKYMDIAEKATENTIDKVFHPETGRTVSEYMHEVDPAEFLPAWLEKNKGKDKDTYKDPAAAGSGGGNGLSGSGRPGGEGSAKKSLFGAK